MEQKTIYALGFFDGVHLGHLALLQECRRLADLHQCKTGVITFTAHPDGLVLGKVPMLLNSNEDRANILHAYGMETVKELPFDRTLMTTHWSSFLTQLNNYDAAGFVCGSDFRFGAGGVGTAKKLAAFCEKRAIPYSIVPEQTLDGVRISSTYIRTLLEQGNMDEAIRFLGHPHILSGKVVSGKQLGRTIGIPTANLLLPEGVICPHHGVYATTCHVNGETYQAVTNVGTRPTVNGQSITVESFLLDFQGELYGKSLIVAFHAFLRPEKKFDSLDALQAAIRENEQQTRAFFAGKPL